MAAKDTNKDKPGKRTNNVKSVAPPVARKSTPRARMAAKAPAATDSMSVIDGNRRRAMIAEAAYFRAERRGFDSGDELRDWLEAEAEIAQRLGETWAV